MPGPALPEPAALAPPATAPWPQALALAGLVGAALAAFATARGLRHASGAAAAVR
jgi:hypothetical protein